ncbi:MAG TPA: thiamine diphosphokinase [Rectinemataceae bacterium]|nr:thiamine diphosphokinase [Rectinemataceae bacterium]
MKALIITGGECPPIRFLKRLALGADFIIAADSGLDAAFRAGIESDLVVGDFDSIKDTSLLDGIPADRKKSYPTDKDETDTEIALQAAAERRADYVIVAGGGGGRLDHLIALLYLFDRQDSPREWHTRKESVFFLKAGESASFAMPKESTVSVFPIGFVSRGMRSSGLKWPLEGLVWEKGQFGISNRSTDSRVDISAGSNALIVVVPIGCKCLFK